MKSGSQMAGINNWIQNRIKSSSCWGVWAVYRNEVEEVSLTEKNSREDNVKGI